MAELFQDIQKPELPEGIINVELSNVEAVVLKTLVFINIPVPITETKYILKKIFGSDNSYSCIKPTSVDKSLVSLEKKELLIRDASGCFVNPDIADKIMPLAKGHVALLKAAAAFFARNYYYSYKGVAVRLSIMANDFKSLDKLLYLSSPYCWNNTAELICDALLEAGDFTYIIPLLPHFHENQRDMFLDSLPLLLHYEGFEDLKEIYLSPEVKPGIYSKYVYASCAHLVLPVDEVVELTNALGLDSNTLFFSSLLQGDVDKALEQASDFLADIQEKEGHRRKVLPGAYGLLYALVLLSAGGTKKLSLAATFIRSMQKQVHDIIESYNPFLSFGEVILLFINHKIGKQTTTAKSIINTYGKGFHRYFLTAVLNWFGKPATDSVFLGCVSDKEELEYRAAGLKVEGDSSDYCEKRLAELRAKFNFIPLAEIYKPEEAWEDVLSILANELAKNKNSAAQARDKRLIWLVDPMQDDCIKCLEQSKNKNGWTKGKERSLTRMISACPDFASEEDKNVLSYIEKHPYYNGFYIKNWNKLLKVLSSHPEVYTVSEPHLPLSIRIQEAQIQIDKNKQGATIKLNPPSPEPRVMQETPVSYIYTEWSPQALKVHSVLIESNKKEIVIPQSGMKKAKPVIERLNEVMPVTGNFAQNSAEKVKSANIPVFQLTPVNDQLHVQLLIEVLEGGEALFVPGIGSAEVLVKTDKGKLYNVVRNRVLEKSVMMDLTGRIDWLQEMKSSSPQLFLDDDEDILDFLASVKEYAPEVKMIWPKGERMRVVKVLSRSDFNISIKKSRDWFDIEGGVVVDEALTLSIQQLLDKSKGGALKYIQLDDKTYLSICSDLQKRLASLDAVAHTKGKKLSVHPLGSGSVENFIEGAGHLKTDKEWKQHLKKLDQLKNYEASLPDNLQAELRPYQQEGVLWLDRLHHWGVGACLADDMGLGKTIQAISILLKYSKNGASLVLAPASVCNNWVKELVRFAPTLNPVVLKTQNRTEALDSLGVRDVLVVSYGLLQANPDLLVSCDWNIVILDEAHAIKNSKSVRSKAVMKLNAKFRLITTGTPMQNHLGELWNLFQFINPGMLGSSDQFVKKFVKNDNGSENLQVRKSLNKYIAPFILRRNKNDVLDDLPRKTEITLNVSLSDKERAMYEALRQEAVGRIESNDEAQAGAKHLQILAEITKLRQMSCNPQLVVPGCDIPSSKLEALEKLIDDLRDANHKALVFSQFTRHLGLIRTMLDKKGVSYQYLDGSTPLKQREEAIDNFQSGSSDVFLISLKAGGVGLNLTAADYVIHMDPWWNPAVEDQASDRAHRIGQTRPVTIYRIIAENTIEEKIVKLHHDKRDLADQLLADAGQSAKISSEELMALIAENDDC